MSQNAQASFFPAKPIFTEGPWPLPSGWEWKRLGNCVRATERTDPTKRPHQSFTYIDIASVDPSSGLVIDPKVLFGADAPSRARKVVRTNDVIFATTRPYLRNVAIVLPHLDQAVCSTGCCVLRATENTEPSWIYWICRSPLVSSQLLAQMRGASYPAVTDSDVLSVYVPVPPHLIQHCIVARIEALMAELKEACALAAAICRDTDRIMEAALAEAVSAFDRRFQLLSIGQLVEARRLRLVGGGTPSKANTTYWTGPIPWVSPKDMKRWLIDNAEDHISLNAVSETSAKRVMRGAVLVVVRGMILAHTWPVAVTTVDVAINQDMKALCPNESLKPEYLGYVLRARTREVLPLVETAAHGTRRLKSETLEAVAIPDAPLPMQEQIVTYLDFVQSEVNEMCRLQVQDAELLDQLEQSILERAFRGEL